MTNVVQWISLFIGIAVVAWVLVGFINGLLLKPDEPEHSARGNPVGPFSAAISGPAVLSEAF
ncbi:MAG TPA: hypothetical protein VIL63_07340 [Terriglobales bacterium]